ncbi:MAG: glycosyl transferase family 1 [Candidatus Moranbacteria bacterium CG_4_9_14_3_um_filter_40_7]|nr:MAG: glycosyl transferase family 1 [Candidatus Moranbacteria bacterium CG23_combo_of_CG06-09_8_20_14_all_40_16]PJA87947.1 MAG: glycosyl transferase family 1 [Candidatus Moranbacteria bacterium CG_4_9_14_3_um_filter_40_7]
MKIAFIGQKGIPVQFGGVERRVEELSVRMVQMGHEVFVYARNDYTSRNIRKYKGVRIIHLPFIPTKNLSAISHTFLATWHAIFKGYDVVHYQAPGPSSLCWLIKFFRPRTALIATFNSRDNQHQKWGKFARFYLEWGEKIIVTVPDKTIVVSQILKEYAKQKYNKETVVINNGSAVIEKPGNYEAIKKWRLENRRYFLTVSRLVRHKGIHYLIEAFNNLQKIGKIPADFKLVIVGDSAFTDDYVQYLKDLSRENTNIIFTGNQKGLSLARLYSCAYTFVQPSEAEGLSNSLLEAMGYGLAPIVSDIAENLLPVGDTGIIFQSKNIKNLEEKMLLSLEKRNLILDLGQKAKARVKFLYDWDRNALETLALYRRIMTQKRKSSNLTKQKLPVSF